jgi:hypothetical protein
MGSYSSYYCHIMNQKIINFISTMIVGIKRYSNKKSEKLNLKIKIKIS